MRAKFLEWDGKCLLAWVYIMNCIHVYNYYMLPGYCMSSYLKISHLNLLLYLALVTFHRFIISSN
jgi:hypothetical protein